MISLSRQIRIRGELSALAEELRQLLVRRVMAAPHVHFRQELIDAIEVSPPEFEKGIRGFRVRLRPAGNGKWDKAEVAERGFGGSGPMDPSPAIGKEGPYRMNELLLRRHPDGVNIKFDLSKAQVSARVQGILESAMFAGRQGAAKMREQHVARLRRQIFASPATIQEGKGVLQPVSWTSHQGADGKTHFRSRVELIGSNMARLSSGNMPVAHRSPSLPEGSPTKAHKHKTDLLHGLIRMEHGGGKSGKGKIEQSPYVIFRRISQNSDPWIHGGIRGAHVLRDWRAFPETRRILRKVDALMNEYFRSMRGSR